MKPATPWTDGLVLTPAHTDIEVANNDLEACHRAIELANGHIWCASVKLSWGYVLHVSWPMVGEIVEALREAKL